MRIKTGDFLFYHRVRTAGEALIDLGATIEDGEQPRIVYHCALALDEKNKIEAVSPQGVRIAPIVYDGAWVATRPPIRPGQIDRGIEACKKDLGEHYDNWLIVDDALRDLSEWVFKRPVLHLPEWLVHRTERAKKICSTLLLVYGRAASWVPSSVEQKGKNVSPEDWWIATRVDRVV
jgi:hypothetical protein